MEFNLSTLHWILFVSLAGGLLSVLAAAAMTFAAGAQRVNVLISYAIGALLGAAFLEVLPHALEHGDPQRMASLIWLDSLSSGV